MSRTSRSTARPLWIVGKVRVGSGPSRWWILLLGCRRPLLRQRFPSTTLSQTVQTLGFEAVLAFAWFPHVFGESAAGGHGC